MVGMKKHLVAIHRMAQLANQTDVSLDDLHNFNRDTGVDYFDQGWRDRFSEKNVSEEALKQYLEDLSEEDLSRVHAIMYSGRNNEPAAGIKEDFLSTSRDDKIGKIMEKRSVLDTLLEKGVEHAQQSGINLDSF